MNTSLYREEEPWMRPLMDSYYNGMPWSVAIIHHNVSDLLSKPNSHGNYALGKILTKEKCLLCNGEIFSYFPSKKENQDGLKWAASASCINCGHKPYNSYCNCETCKIERRQQKAQQQKEARERETEEKAAMIAKVKERVVFLNSESVPIEESHTYNEWAILLAMIEQSTSEDSYYITPLSKCLKPFSPSEKYTHTLIQKVIHSLTFADSCPLSAWIEEGSLHWQGMYEPYLLHGKTSNPKKYLLDQLKSCSFNCADAEIITLDIKDLMLNEALMFLEKTREEYRLPHQIGDKTRQVLENLILNRPLGEVLYLIWKACNDAAASAQKATITRSHASNLVIGNMERMHVRARIEGWKLPCYKRFQFGDQNWMSYVYFNLVLGLPGEGLGYSWLDVMKRQDLHQSISLDHSILADTAPEAFEALKELARSQEQDIKEEPARDST